MAILRGMADDDRVTDRSPFLVEMLQGTLALFSDRSKRTMAEALKMTKRAMARAALQVTGGNVERAAEILEVSRRTVHRVANDNSIAPPADLWHRGSMTTPFDDQLFPFVRILWPAEPPPTFIDDYEDWFVGEIIPRATAENTQVVTLENCSSLTGLPSQEFRNALKAICGKRRADGCAPIGPER